MGRPWWLSEREVSLVNRLISCAVVTRFLRKGRDIYQAVVIAVFLMLPKVRQLERGGDLRACFDEITERNSWEIRPLSLASSNFHAGGNDLRYYIQTLNTNSKVSSRRDGRRRGMEGGRGQSTNVQFHKCCVIYRQASRQIFFRSWNLTNTRYKRPRREVVCESAITLDLSLTRFRSRAERTTRARKWKCIGAFQIFQVVAGSPWACVCTCVDAPTLARTLYSGPTLLRYNRKMGVSPRQWGILCFVARIEGSPLVSPPFLLLLPLPSLSLSLSLSLARYKSFSFCCEHLSRAILFKVLHGIERHGPADVTIRRSDVCLCIRRVLPTARRRRSHRRSKEIKGKQRRCTSCRRLEHGSAPNRGSELGVVSRAKIPAKEASAYKRRETYDASSVIDSQALHQTTASAEKREGITSRETYSGVINFLAAAASSFPFD